VFSVDSCGDFFNIAAVPGAGALKKEAISALSGRFAGDQGRESAAAGLLG
jgi:hypothetical protein